MNKYNLMFTGSITLIMVLSVFVGRDIYKMYEKAKQAPETVYIERDISPIPYDYLGEYILTHYCDCPICTGTPKGSRTASGTKPKEGRTIACDGKTLKMGDIVYIETIGLRVCEDRGGAIKGNKIDVFVADHNRAVNMGIKKARVYKLL